MLKFVGGFPAGTGSVSGAVTGSRGTDGTDDVVEDGFGVGRLLASRDGVGLGVRLGLFGGGGGLV